LNVFDLSAYAATIWPFPIKEDCLLNPDMFREIISKVTLGQEN
jgi:hypothetical protein